MEFVKLSPHHSDIVTDMSFDYYGKRLATCSTDKNIKVWTLVDDEWICQDIHRAHQDSIWRLSWAHPEYGQLIASCSEDGSVKIWEEQELISGDKSSRKDPWVDKATLSDGKRPINDVKFAPRHLGLKIAAASADGFVRIYEATDIFSLTNWTSSESFLVENTSLVEREPNSEHGLTCLSWSDCPFEIPRLAIGGHSKRAVVWALKNSKWIEESVLGSHGDTIHDIAWAPSMGRSYHLIATASREDTFQVLTRRLYTASVNTETGSHTPTQGE